MDKVCYNCFKPCNAKHCGYCGYEQGSSSTKYTVALSEGSVLNGKYIIGRVLGQGGFGITYVAQDYETKQLVAIKEYFPDSLVTRSSKITVSTISADRQGDFNYGKECFLNEAKTLAQLNGNPNIVRIYSYFEENNTAYFTMEYLDGESFLSLLKREGKVSWDEARKILEQVMNALEFVHSKGIIHRDISPDNIYLCKDGAVKLIDFGAARYSLGDRSQSLSVVLKHGYAPHEQYARRGKQGPYTDIYALAATMYRALTGRVPPEAIDRIYDSTLPMMSSVGVDIPKRDEEALSKALSVHYFDRFQTIEEFRKALTPPEPSEEPVEEPEEENIEEHAEGPVSDEHEETKAPETDEEHEVSEAIVNSVKEKKKSRKGIIIAIAVIAAAIIAAAVVIPNLTSPKQESSQTEEAKISIPSVEGMKKSKAYKTLYDAGLSPEITEKYSDKVKSGMVISQKPAADTLVDSGAKVKVIVSLGPQPTVPSLVGKSQSEAEKLLGDVGLKLKVSGKKYSSEYIKGTVMAQSPAAGTKTDKGETVSVTISKGAKPAPQTASNNSNNSSDNRSDNNSSNYNNSSDNSGDDNSTYDDGSGDYVSGDTPVYEETVEVPDNNSGSSQEDIPDDVVDIEDGIEVME